MPCCRLPTALVMLATLAACAAATPADSCVLLRLRDRNLRALERRATEAGGLDGPRAGAYLTVEEVADLSGRSKHEVVALADGVRQLGGALQLVGPLRDRAVACFPAPELAEGLATALPAHLASMVAAIQPLPSTGDADAGASQRRRLQGQMATGSPKWRGPITNDGGAPLQPAAFGVGTAAAATLPAWTPVQGSFQLSVPSGYGPPLPAKLGKWNGFADPSAGTAWGVPQVRRAGVVGEGS